MDANRRISQELSAMKDKELIEQMEALEDVIEWLEERDSTDIVAANKKMYVEEDEVDEWLKSPKLKKVLDWMDNEE